MVKTQKLRQILLSGATVLYLFPLNAMETEMDPKELGAPTNKRPYGEVQQNKQEKTRKKRKIREKLDLSYDVVFSHLSAGDNEYVEKVLKFFGKQATDSEYRDIASAYHQTENFVKALEYYEKVIEFLKEKAGIFDYISLGDAYDHVGNSVKAVECYEKVIELCDGNIRDLGVEVFYFHLTKCYVKLKNADEKVIQYGELWYKEEGLEILTFEEGEEILQDLRAAHTRMGNSERAAFFGKVLEEFNQEDVEGLSEEEESDQEHTRDK